jgi:platelet-activating factor acetylhydrolase
MEAVEDLSPDVSRRLPVLILSHGLGGTATAYAKLCCSVASNGWLVLALEHQDGTASATVSFSGTPRYYQRPNVRDSETKRRQARRIQLDQRCQEIQQVIEWLHDSGEVPADDPLLQSLHQVIDSAQITLCGHSFGGATVARWCYTMEARRFPLKYCILLDPWFWPLLEEDGRLPSLMDQPTPTLIVVNELFFQSVTPAEREALRSWPALHRLMLLGAAHQVQSDFEHRLPRCVVRLAQLASQRDPMLLFHVQMEMIMAFIKGNQALFNRIPENHPDMLQRLE